jgi:hypothetical protein
MALEDVKRGFGRFFAGRRAVAKRSNGHEELGEGETQPI